MSGWPTNPGWALETLRAIRTHPNPFVVVHEPVRPRLAWPVAPIPAAVGAIVDTHAARLYALPPESGISAWITLLQFNSDVADARID